MAVRSVWRPPWYAWAIVGAGALALVHQRAAWLLRDHWLLLSVSLLIVVLYVLQRAWDLPPAVMMCAALVLSIFSGNWSSLGLPGFPFLPDRILLVGVVLMLALRAPGSRMTPAIRLKPVHLLLLLLVAYGVGSAAVAGTLGSRSGIFDLLDRLGVIPLAMLVLAPVIFSDRRARSMLLVTLVGLGAYLGITAIFESLGPHALVFPHYIVSADATLPEGRANGPFESPVTEGFACFACAVAAVIACAQWRGSLWRYFAGAVAVICLFACFLTLERGVWLATAAGAVAAALATPTGRRWLIPGAALCAVVIAGALLLSTDLAAKTSTRVSDQASVWARQNQTSAGLRMIAAKPIFGFGWDRFETDGLPYFRQTASYPMNGYSTSQTPLPLHDIYLSMAVELGLVGALLWLAVLVWGIGGAILGRGAPDLRSWKLGLLAIATFFAIVAFVDPLQQNFIELLLWTWAGVALGVGSPSLRPALRATSTQEKGTGARASLVIAST
ncbi:MAG: O-antigen ligase family protein [Solirubrobacteraceae bacterium]